MEGKERASCCLADDTYELGASLEWLRQDTEDSSEGRRAIRFMECPMLEKTVQVSDRVRRIMEDVVVHYSASFSVLSWRADGELHLKASHLPDVIRAPQASGSSGYQLFNHTIGRALPVVVNDVQVHDVYGEARLPEFAKPTRFYMAAPLIARSAAYIGTLCVVDSCRPRAEFHLRDARFLVESAGELVASAEEHNVRAPAVGDPSGVDASRVLEAGGPPAPGGVDGASAESLGGCLAPCHRRGLVSQRVCLARLVLLSSVRAPCWRRTPCTAAAAIDLLAFCPPGVGGFLPVFNLIQDPLSRVIWHAPYVSRFVGLPKAGSSLTLCFNWSGF
ncbi:unnamed protein product [Prorocentrum cordatum]|uniref:GAF domain-containing protein n=1 Tax=Prorocentrum cordatum TaxID=2364126 RepID=A0ABN9QFN5_9DINO|nr:unnamed protein product [Polarella glacialis]